MKPQTFDHCGRRVTMKLIASETGISLHTLYQRWHRGDRAERLTRPVRRHLQGAAA